MSLLVLNSSSKIAQGLIKHFHGKQAFEKIVCADLYKSYDRIKSYCDFKESLQENKTKLTDSKFESKQDLHELISKATHIVHITHDYYEYVPPKQNILKTSAQIAKDLKIKNFFSVNPIEHNHQYDTESQVVDLKSIDSQYGQITSDLIFGEYSTVVNRLAFYLKNKKSLDFQPSQDNVHPLHFQDLNDYVQGSIDGKVTADKIQGAHAITFAHILGILEESSHFQRTQSGLIDNVISPLSNNVASQFMHSAEKRNFLQFFHNYKSMEGVKIGKIDFEGYYSKQKVSAQDDLSLLQKALY